MDKLKTFFALANKYRFWIAVTTACLLCTIGYFVGVPGLQAKEATERASIESAEKGVKEFTSGTVTNAQYKPIVEEKQAVLAKDVNASWTKLYERQAPLLTWPDEVHERFTGWGRKWPEDVDPNRVQGTIILYVNGYKEYVDSVYKIANPWDPLSEKEKGEGIVATPPVEALLRPSPFKVEEPPTLGKVWAAQEKLWIQRTLLEVIAQVNKDAKDWDHAAIKQIDLVEVGNAKAQDQRSIANGDALEEAPDLTAPGAEVASAEEGAATDDSMSSMMSMMSGRGGGEVTAPDVISYIHTESTQYKIMPVMVQVLIDQARIQDFLVELENSPMAIQVMDFEMSKPLTRVVKPVPGQGLNYGLGYGSGMGMMMGMGRGGEMESMMSGMMSMRGAMSGGAGMGSAGMDSMSMMGGYGSGRGGVTAPAKTGQSIREKDAKKQREDREKAAKASAKVSIQDPYYNIVQVTIYGQARFYNPPPAEETVPASEAPTAPEGDPAAATPPAEGTPPADPAAATPPAEGTPPASATSPADALKPESAPAEPPKGETPAPDPAAATPKAEPTPAPGPAPATAPMPTTPGA